jgi:hypothetical protein
MRSVPVVAPALVAAIAVLAIACSSPEPDRVIVEDGTLPPEVTTSAPPTSEVSTTDDSASDLGPPTLVDGSAVSTVGIDEVTFGMALDEAEAAAGTRLLPVDPDHDPSCYDARPEQGPAGLTFLIRDGHVERLDVVEGSLATRSGAGVGTPADEIRSLFGERIQESDDGTVLTFVPADEADAVYRIIFEVPDGQVTAFRAGRLPDVETACA